MSPIGLLEVLLYTTNEVKVLSRYLQG